VLGVDDAQILDLSNNTWDDVLANKIDFWYDHGDSLERIIEHAISMYRPSLLITYDTALGAYGHPEHRMSALAAARVLSNHREDSVFSVQKILQMTIPQSMESELLISRESYLNAVKLTGNTTLPDPSVAFDITPYWPLKRRAALEYTSQAHVLRKFYLLPEDEDTVMHYRTFDREYFFEINR
jgi:LmbE family N-acetylglucosaminyl deacetylase